MSGWPYQGFFGAATKRLDESLSIELLRKLITGKPKSVPDPTKVRVSSTGHLVLANVKAKEGAEVTEDQKKPEPTIKILSNIEWSSLDCSNQCRLPDGIFCGVTEAHCPACERAQSKGHADAGRVVSGGLYQGSVTRVAAYLIRQAAGLDDNEPVILDIGAEQVRKMAQDAGRERDSLHGQLKTALTIIRNHDAGDNQQFQGARND